MNREPIFRMTAEELFIQTILLSALAISIVYISAIRYHVSWTTMLCIIIVISVINGFITTYVTKQVPASDRRNDSILQDNTGTIIVAVITAFATFGIIGSRYGVGSAFLMCVIGGIGSSLMNYLLQPF